MLTTRNTTKLRAHAVQSSTGPAEVFVRLKKRMPKASQYVHRIVFVCLIEADDLQPSGVSYAGASYKFTVFDPKGQRRAQQVGQLPSTSYMSLLTPYSYFGLGRTNNYVENLFVGSTRHQQQHFTNLESLIPNSQVLIDPYQPPGVTDPRSWIRQLYLHPGDWIPGVVLSLVGAMVVLGGIILFLHLKEQVSPSVPITNFLYR